MSSKPAARRAPMRDIAKGIPTLPPIQSRYMSRIPFIASFVGSTGSGKTYCALSLIDALLREKSLTELIIISPTARSNVLYQAVYKPERDQLYEDISTNVFKTLAHLETYMTQKADKYRTELEYAAVYHKYRAGNVLNSIEEWTLERYGYRSIEPQRPSVCLLLDDCSHSAILSASQKNPFSNLVLRSRHVGDGLGLSIAMISQSYLGHAIPKVLRLNTTHLFLWRTESKREIKSILEEVGNMVGEEQFMQMFDQFTRDKHSYCFIDFVQRRIGPSF